MKIYGFYAGSHDPTIAYIEDGKIISVIQEERVKRIKSADDFPQNPHLSKIIIERETGVRMVDSDFIACATPVGYDFILKDNLPKIGVRTFDHHECHAKGAYFTSGFKGKSITFTYDGGGDDSIGSIWLCEDGNMELIKTLSIGKSSSLGQLWMSSTEALGWKMLKDEGKVMGMAGNGKFNQRLYNLLKSVCYYSGEGTLDFSPVGSKSKTYQILNQLKSEGWFVGNEKRYEFAYNLQKLTEDIMIEFVNDLIKIYPEWSKKISFAGGLFANVKMNQKINELNHIEEIWVFPPMGDEGLALGSAIALANQLGDWDLPKKLENVFFGLRYSNEQIEAASKKWDFFSIDFHVDTVADLLIEGKIGAFFNGRFEYGPRSLGARSIIVKATDRKTHDLLNERLERHEVMPFAPVVLKDKAQDIFHNANKSSYAAEFMTCCYSVKDEWIERIPACIHTVDNTGRPQFANPETNSDWYNLVFAYYKKTGIPIILNTSFNGHGEPIIDNPEQAFKHLEKGTVDFLIMEQKIYFKK
jgi:carbamoyltransferase